MAPAASDVLGRSLSDLRLTSLINSDGQLVPATSGQVAAALAAPHKLLHLTLHGRPRAWAPREEEAWARRWHVALHPIRGAIRTASKTSDAQLASALHSRFQDAQERKSRRTTSAADRGSPEGRAQGR